MIDVEIATYWNVETLYYVFNGVAAIMGGSGFAGLLKMVFFFSIMFGIFAYAGNRQLEMATWFIQALIFTTLLNMPIARVAITDRTDLESPRTVDNVPFALAIVAQTANLSFGWLTRTYEAVFGVPETLGLQQGDLAFGHRILKNVNKVIIREPGLRADLMQFIKECTLYDLKDGAITPNQMIASTDTWNTMFSNTSPARFVTYDTLTPSPITDTCVNVGTVLKTRVNDGIAAAQKFYGRSNFSRANSDDAASSLFASAIGTSYDWILSSSASASDAMKQAMFNNLWHDAGSELPALLNDPARISELQAMAGAGQAAKQADNSNSTLSMLAQETLPHTRNWLEAIIYAMFPIVVVMMIMLSTEGAKKLIGGYMMSLCWVGMWPVMFAIINHLSLLHLKHKMAGLALASAGGVPFQLSDVFDATLGNEQAAIGYLVVLVPFLSGALIKMGQGGFMSVADRMVSGVTSAGSSVGASWASGNVSMGQAGIDTASVNSTAMHKYNTDIGMRSGGASFELGQGGTSEMAANGTVALQQFQSRMLTQMSVGSRFQADRSEEGHTTDITSRGTQLSVRRGEASTLTDVTGHDTSRGAYQQVGVSAGVSKAGNESGVHGSGQGLNRQYSDRSHFSASTGVSDQGYMGASLGGSIGGGGGGGGGVGANPTNPAGPGGGRVAAPNAQEEQRMVKAMQQGGASQADVDKAVRNYRGGAGDAAPRTGSSGGPSLGGTVGLQSQRNYTAAHGRDRAEGDSLNVDENARISRGYQISAQRGVTNGTGQQSNQNDRHGRDAALTNVDERSTVRDVSDRAEAGVGNRGSRSASESVSLSRDMMADPNFISKVAARNGMSAARFMGLEEGRILAMVKDYAAEKGVFHDATTMPKQGLSGEAIPTTRRDLRKRSEHDREELPDDIATRHRRKAAATGFGGTAPVNADTTMPALVDAAEKEVRTHLDPKSGGSIPDRAAALTDNAHAWASPDRELGEGRAKPAAVTEGMIGRDIANTATDVKNAVLNFGDRLTGGDGTKHGPNYTPNQKRETQTHLDIDQPGQGPK